MIMRDSEKTLPRCLDSVAGLVDEIIIVDTGSKDNSINIAKAYGAKIVKDPWQDDFARPRNVGLRYATCQWILIMDPDEMIFRKDQINIKWLTRTNKYVAFHLTTFNYSPMSRSSRYRRLPNGMDPTGKFPGYTPSTKTRFFKNGLGIKFEGCWHELADWYIIRNKLLIAKSLIPIHHWTHEFEQKSWAAKRNFYLRMGEKKVKEWPKSGKAWWELSVAEATLNLPARASHSIAKAIRLGFADKDQFFALSQYQRQVNQKEKADFIFEKGVCKLFPNLTHLDLIHKPLEAAIDGI